MFSGLLASQCSDLTDNSQKNEQELTEFLQLLLSLLRNVANTDSQLSGKTSVSWPEAAPAGSGVALLFLPHVGVHGSLVYAGWL